MRRTELKRGSSALRRTPLAPEGPCGRRFRAEYDAIRPLVWERSEGMCEWPGCHAPAWEIHHVRGRWPKDANAPGNLRAICRFHHDIAHLVSPSRARAAGMLACWALTLGILTAWWWGVAVGLGRVA